MSAKDKKTQEPEPEAARGPTAPEPEVDEGEVRPARYEFKIVPADPKNALDFEDVADK